MSFGGFSFGKRHGQHAQRPVCPALHDHHRPPPSVLCVQVLPALLLPLEQPAPRLSEPQVRPPGRLLLLLPPRLCSRHCRPPAPPLRARCLQE